MTQPFFAVLTHRGAIRVSGPDSHHFLQNLITSDVEEIDKQGAGFGALLTPQGKILFDFLIYRDGDAYLLDAPLETVACLIGIRSLIVDKVGRDQIVRRPLGILPRRPVILSLSHRPRERPKPPPRQGASLWPARFPAKRP